MPTIEQPRIRRDHGHQVYSELLPSYAPRGTVFQFGIPALLGLLGVCAMAVDMPIARCVNAHYVPDEIKKILDLAEVFAHGYGVVAVLLAVWVLSPRSRVGLGRVLLGWLLAGVAANLVKMLISRRRPLRISDLDIEVFETFQSWLPMLSAGSAGQSFPSGHATSTTALALGLAWLIPRGKWLFATFAALAAMQRMASGYHYLSDTLWGASLGWFCAASILPGGWLAGRFNRLGATKSRPESPNSPHLTREA